MTALTRALDVLYHLKVGVTGVGADRHERPHKPLLLLAVLESLDAGEATPDRVEWSRGLIARFRPAELKGSGQRRVQFLPWIGRHPTGSDPCGG